MENIISTQKNQVIDLHRYPTTNQSQIRRGHAVEWSNLQMVSLRSIKFQVLRRKGLDHPWFEIGREVEKPQRKKSPKWKGPNIFLRNWKLAKRLAEQPNARTSRRSTYEQLRRPDRNFHMVYQVNNIIYSSLKRYWANHPSPIEFPFAKLLFNQITVSHKQPLLFLPTWVVLSKSSLEEMKSLFASVYSMIARLDRSLDPRSIPRFRFCDTLLVQCSTLTNHAIYMLAK